MPSVPDGYRIHRRRRSSYTGLSDASDLQRNRGFRRGGNMGFAGHVGRRRGHALDSRPFLGPEALEIQGARRIRRSEKGRYRGFQNGDRQWQCAVDAHVDFTRHEPGRAAADCQRHDLRLWQRREYLSSLSGRRPGFSHGAPDPSLDSCHPVRARRADWQGTVVQRQADHQLEPLERNRAGKRADLYQHLRRNSLLLWLEEMRLLLVLMLLASFRLLHAQSDEPSPSRAELERELDAYRRILLDWGGLTRYGSENTELRLAPGEGRVV